MRLPTFRGGFLAWRAVAVPRRLTAIRTLIRPGRPALFEPPLLETLPRVNPSIFRWVSIHQQVQHGISVDILVGNPHFTQTIDLGNPDSALSAVDVFMTDTPSTALSFHIRLPWIAIYAAPGCGEFIRVLSVRHPTRRGPRWR